MMGAALEETPMRRPPASCCSTGPWPCGIRAGRLASAAGTPETGARQKERRGRRKPDPVDHAAATRSRPPDGQRHAARLAGLEEGRGYAAPALHPLRVAVQHPASRIGTGRAAGLIRGSAACYGADALCSLPERTSNPAVGSTGCPGHISIAGLAPAGTSVPALLDRLRSVGHERRTSRAWQEVPPWTRCAR